MSTENVAVLFTDVVGSTALAQNVSAETADEVRRGHFSILRQAVAEAGGTEVKNLGDGLMVVFSSASAALGCAVAMQQGVDRDNAGREHPVGLRVGLSQGEVTHEDDDFFGDPVIEAARLCAACESGQILAADVVRLMAGRRNHHPCTPIGELTLKGLPDPVATVEVGWEPLAGADAGPGVPLPGRLAVMAPVGVVGRETELAAVADAVKRVTAGERLEVLLVSGEAGLGKTTLVAEAARAAFDGGACVLFGHCEEDLATPYQLFAEALGHYVTHAPEDQLAFHVDAHGGELARLVPSLAGRIPDLPPSKAGDADTERYLLLAAVVALLRQVSGEQPVVLVLDDLQWADKASLLLLRHLATSDEALRVLVVGTYGDTELSRSHPLLDTLAALHRQQGVARIELTGLDDTGVIAFMEAAASYALDEDGIALAHALYRETDGNPFFVTEVLRHLTETGAVSQDAGGRWVADAALQGLALPDSVREVIGARVGRLGQDAERVLSLAAVIGRDFDLDLLSRAAERSEDDVLDVLDAAADVALVRELPGAGGRHTFAHALIQHTLYEDLGPTRRARTHRRVAEALEDLCGDRPGSRVGELARHWLAATQPIDLERAIGYSKQAADAALAALAPGDALHYYAQALDLLGQADDADPLLDVDLTIGLGIAQRQTGDRAFRETLLDAARRADLLDDTGRLVAAALANTRGWMSAIGAIDQQKVDVLETTRDRLPADDPQRALVLATLCAELMFGSPLEQRRALADEATAIAEASGDDAVIALVLNHVFLPLIVPSLLAESLARTAEALDRAARSGDPWLIFFAASHRQDAAGRAGDLAEKDRCLDIAGAMAERLQQPSLLWMHGFTRAQRAFMAGDTAEADRGATAAFAVGDAGGEPDAVMFLGAHQIQMAWLRGAMAEVVPLMEQLSADTPVLPHALASGLARALADAERFEDARSVLAEVASTGFEHPIDQMWCTDIGHYAEAAVLCGDASSAGPLHDLLAPWADQWVATGATCDGPVSHYLGGLAAVLGRFDEAHAHFGRSAAVCAAAGAPFFAARTDLQWGTMLAQRGGPGDTEKAADLLRRAHVAAVAKGYGAVERRAEAALHGMA